jgi:hypothetical protein
MGIYPRNSTLSIINNIPLLETLIKLLVFVNMI